MSHFAKYLFSFICLVALVAVVGRAGAAEVALNRQGGEIVISAAVQSDFAGSEASISAPDTSTIEIGIPGADFAVDGKRQLFRFEDDAIKAVSVSRYGGNGIVRFNIREKNAGLIADLIRVTRADERIFLTIPTQADGTGQVIAGTKLISIAAAPSKNEASISPPAGVVSEAAIGTASLTGGAGPKVSEPAPIAVIKDKRPESEIPVFTDKSEAKKAGSSSLERLVLTLFVVCALLGAALFGIKRWTARRGKNAVTATKIQILTQHHLGPKKSLAIIQVAGEAILIGITDQNISMLKTLALIDDEVPGVVPKNFSDELDDDASAAEARQQLEDEGYESENFALRGLTEVRDMVSTRFSSRGTPNRDSRRDM